MLKIRIHLKVCIFLSLALNTVSAAEQSLEKEEPPTKEAALSRLMGSLPKEKSPLPLNIPLDINQSDAQVKAAAVSQAEHRDLEIPTPLSQAPQSPPVIAVGVIVRFKSPEIQALARDNLPPPPEVIAELEAALGEKLVFERATVNEAYVFSFLVPKEGKEAISAFLQPAKELPSIDWIEANRRVQIQSSSAQTPPSMVSAQSFSYDPDYAFQWNMMGGFGSLLGGIDAVSAWDITHGSPDTIVAVVDSGVLPHPEFAGRLLPGYDFISDPLGVGDGDGRDSDASDPGVADCGHSSWHGTHVAGIIAASGDNGFGIAGVNWRTRILPVRVLGPCNGSDDDIRAGMAWAAGLEVGSSIPGITMVNPYPAQVINVSLGREGECSNFYQKTINKILEQGALVVVAAGNAKTNVEDYVPANCKGVMVVVATDLSGNLAPYSNVTDFSEVDVAIAAPDGYKGKPDYDGIHLIYPHPENGILSTVDVSITTPQGFTYDWYEGTSMAAPHVSGIASLMLAINPRLSGAELLFWLKAASRPFPDTSFLCNLGSCGVGIADAYQSVINAMNYKKYQLVSCHT